MSPGMSVMLREIVSMERRDVEDEVGDQRLLPQLAIDMGFERQPGRIGNLVGSHQSRSHRAEAVDTFAEKPLLVLMLQGPSGHVVDDRIAENVIHRFGARDTATAASNHDGELALVVDAIGRVEIGENGCIRSNHRRRRLGEDHRRRRHVLP